MKTAILSLVCAFISIVFTNTLEAKNHFNGDPVKKEKKIYLWKVITSAYEFTGTATTYGEAVSEMKKVSKNQTVISKKIMPVTVKPGIKNKIYVWETKSTDGEARGVETSKNKAKKAIENSNKGSVMQSKIIESYQVKKTR